MNHRDKVVFIAGGTTGINLGIAEAFVGAGARVAVLSRKQENVDAALQVLNRQGPAIGFACDVRDYDAVAAALLSTVEQWGPIDVVVSGAAGNFVAAADQLSSNGFRTVVEIDLVGTFHVMRAAFEHLRKPGASLVNITAPQASLPTPRQIHVCAAKAGIDQATRTAAMEWGRFGVRVNAVSPGPIEDTEGMRRLAPTPAAELAWTESIPLRCWGTRRDIANAVLWLCSDQARYVTGIVLPVDGGWSLGGSSAMTMALQQP